MPQVRGRSAGQVAWIGLTAALMLIALAALVPAATGWDVQVKWFPPLHATWDPRLGPGTLPALIIAAGALVFAPRLLARLPWRMLLLTCWVVGAAWALSLAFVDGGDGVGRILETDYEYLQTARATDDLPHTLSIYTSKIPLDAPTGNWPTHIAGHPPGALTFFVLLDRIGLGGGFAAGLVVSLIGASAAAGVLVTARVLGAEDFARRAAPFLTLGPAAIWQAVSADAVFAAVAAWGIAALAYAATRSSLRAMVGFSLLAGSLLGYLVMLSYGLPLLGVLAVAVLVVARAWRPLIPTVLAACTVVGTYAFFGFAWWDAIGVLRDRYWDGIAHLRPGAYWIWANLAALAVACGPLVGSGLAACARRVVRPLRPVDASTRVVLWLCGSGVVMVLAADLSQMSKAEVERIWLPFVPWLLLSCSLLPERWRSRGLALQLGFALLVQHLLRATW